MKIFADSNIPYVEQVFDCLGEVTIFNGRSVSPSDIAAADILLVRSVTKVNESLLKGSNVRFVGTATIGTDHIDLGYLRDKQIGFSNAPGCNAVSAAEYVVCALLLLAKKRGFCLAETTAGIIGYGNVGSRVEARLSALGITCLVNDPPREKIFHDRNYVEKDEILKADIVTIHVPLERSGPHATYHLIGADFLGRLKPNATFINTSRGEVIDETDLHTVLDRRPDLGMVLDVWDGEPNIDTNLITRLELTTPHIAGYSLDGKVRATEMIYRQVCRYFNLPEHWKPIELPDAVALKEIIVLDQWEDQEAIYQVTKNAYNLKKDNERMRRMLEIGVAEQAHYFDYLRREYPNRREFDHYQIVVPAQRHALCRCLAQLGFQVRHNISN